MKLNSNRKISFFSKTWLQTVLVLSMFLLAGPGEVLAARRTGTDKSGTPASGETGSPEAAAKDSASVPEPQPKAAEDTPTTKPNTPRTRKTKAKAPEVTTQASTETGSTPEVDPSAKTVEAPAPASTSKKTTPKPKTTSNKTSRKKGPPAAKRIGTPSNRFAEDTEQAEPVAASEEAAAPTPKVSKPATRATKKTEPKDQLKTRTTSTSKKATTGQAKQTASAAEPKPKARRTKKITTVEVEEAAPLSEEEKATAKSREKIAEWIFGKPSKPVSKAQSTRPGVGIELEYAYRLLDTKTSKAPPEKYMQPLEELRKIYKAMGLGEGEEVKLAIWEKDPKKKMKMAVWTDPFDRQWKVVPEFVDAVGGRDGTEIVTPPLDRDFDQEVFHRFVAGIENTGNYRPGQKSSVHFTVSANHLYDGVGDQDDASKLVDTILFIENHWPEIYSTISPRRYGTLINKFAVPVAAEQELKQLLHRLAALPKDQRTFGNVRRLFAEYDDIERSLPAEPDHSWKYRSANYKKIFNLGGADYVPVIEFRIPDLVDSQSLSKQMGFFQTLMESAHKVAPDTTVFKDPFKDALIDEEVRNDKKTRFFDSLNKRIKDLPEQDYNKFLTSLNIDPKEFPQLARAKGPLTMGRTRAEMTKFIDNYDTGRTIEFPGATVPATFGWEAEVNGSSIKEVTWKVPLVGWLAHIPWKEPFKFSNWQKLIVATEPADFPDFDGMWHDPLHAFEYIGRPWNLRLASLRFSRVNDYKYLNWKTEMEAETGNTELTSRPTEILDTAISQMKEMRETLGTDLKGFHLHIRVPKEAYSRIDPAELHAWLSRISDTAMAWRLHFKKRTWYGLQSATHTRLFPTREQVADRGAVRAMYQDTVQEGENDKHLGDSLDIELRGFMRSQDAAHRLAKVILAGFENPELIRGFPKMQALLMQPKTTLAGAINDFSKNHKGRELTHKEMKFLKEIEEEFTKYNFDANVPIYKQTKSYDGTNSLPLMGFEEAPYLTDMERQRVRDANFSFRRNVFEMMNEWKAEIPDDEDSWEQLLADYRWKIKYWARATEYHATLNRTLLLDPALIAERDKFAPMEEDYMHRLGHVLSAGDQNMLDKLKNLPDREFFEKIGTDALDPTMTPDPVTRAKAVDLMENRNGEEFIRLMKRAMRDKDEGVIKAAARVLGKRDDIETLNLLKNYVIDKNEKYRVETTVAAVEGMAMRKEPEAKTWVKRVLVSQEDAWPEAEQAAARMLGFRGTPEQPAYFAEDDAFKYLRHAAKENTNVDVNIEIMRALVNFTRPEVYDRKDKTKSGPMQVLLDRYWEENGVEEMEVRKEAAKLLVQNIHRLLPKQIQDILEEGYEKQGRWDRLKEVAAEAWTNKSLKPFLQLKTSRLIPEFRQLHLAAARELGNKKSDKDSDVVPALKMGLEHEDPEVRKLTAEALAGRVSGASREVILEALEHKDIEVVRTAVLALRDREESANWSAKGGGLRGLLETLLTHKDAQVRKNAALVINNPRSFDGAPLVIAALGGQDDSIKAEAAKKLVGMPGDKAEEAISIASGSKLGQVRAAAAEAMAQRLSEGQTIKGLPRDILLPMLKDDDKTVVKHAIVGLSKLPTATLIEFVDDAFRSGRSRKALPERTGILQAAKLAADELRAKLVDPSTKKEAQSALEAKLSKLHDVFQAAMQDPDRAVLDVAYDHFVTGDKTKLIQALRATTQSPSEDTTKWAAEALAKTSWADVSPKDEQELLKLASDLMEYNPDVAKEAAKAIAQRNTKAALKILQEKLRSDNPKLSSRIAASVALIGRKDKESLPLVVEGLKDSNPDIRANSALALKGRTQPEVLEHVSRGLEHTDPNVRAGVATVLPAWHGTDEEGKKVWPVIQKAVNHPDPAVQIQGLNAMANRSDLMKEISEKSKLGDESIRNQLLDKLGGADDKVVAAAKEAVSKLNASHLLRLAEEGFQEENPKLHVRLIEIAQSKPKPDQKYLDVVRNGFASKHEEVREAAIRYFDSRGDASFLEAVNFGLEKNGSVEGRRQLGRIIDYRFAGTVSEKNLESFQNHLKKISTTADPNARAVSIRKIQGLLPGDAPHLIEMLKQSDEVRATATKILMNRYGGGKTMPPEVESRLLKVVERLGRDEDQMVRESGAKVLGKLHSDAAVDLASRLVTDGDPRVAHSAFPALRERESSPSLFVLQNIIRGNDDHLKKQATAELARRTDPAAAAVRSNFGIAAEGCSVLSRLTGRGTRKPTRMTRGSGPAETDEDANRDSGD